MNAHNGDIVFRGNGYEALADARAHALRVKAAIHSASGTTGDPLAITTLTRLHSAISDAASDLELLLQRARRES